MCSPKFAPQPAAEQTPADRSERVERGYARLSERARNAGVCEDKAGQTTHRTPHAATHQKGHENPIGQAATGRHSTTNGADDRPHRGQLLRHQKRGTHRRADGRKKHHTQKNQIICFLRPFFMCMGGLGTLLNLSLVCTVSKSAHSL